MAMNDHDIGGLVTALRDARLVPGDRRGQGTDDAMRPASWRSTATDATLFPIGRVRTMTSCAHGDAIGDPPIGFQVRLNSRGEMAKEKE